jgi:hypothetical protein
MDSLRRPPATEAGDPNHIWRIEDMVDLGQFSLASQKLLKPVSSLESSCFPQVVQLLFPR